METFSDRLKKQRDRLDITQSKLAQMINVSPQVVSNWEREYTYPDYLDLIRLSEALDVTIDYLLTSKSSKVSELDEEYRLWLEFGKELEMEGYDLEEINILLKKMISVLK
jgi:transcriptional regulator with XRE-family HTH domain